MVQRVLSVSDKAFVTFDLDYALPDVYTRAAPASAGAAAGPATATPASQGPSSAGAAQADAPRGPARTVAPDLERQAAADRHPDGGAGGAGGHLLLQDQLARRPLLLHLRLAFLLFALFWIGWYGQAQLSVVNVLTFFSALRSDFRWDYFLMDPLVFILWCATAVSMVFWNRGAFCGWLCPFGALQELLNRAAKRLGVKQLQVPHGVNQRLSALKYIIFVLLFGYALYDLALAERLAESSPSRPPSSCASRAPGPSCCSPRCCWPRGSSSNASIAATCARWARRWRFRAPAHLQLAQALSRLRQSLPALQPRMPGAGHRAQRRNQSQQSASSACTARCSTTTTKSARTCCSARPGARTPPRPARRGRAAVVMRRFPNPGDAGQPPAGA